MTISDCSASSSWCDNLLQKYHQEGYNKHEIIFKFRQLLTLIWMNYQKLKEFLFWLEKKKILSLTTAIFKDCCIHEFIVLEIYNESKLITSYMLETATKTILQQLLFRFQILYFYSRISQKISQIEENFHLKTFRDLILREYQERRRTVHRYVHSVMCTRCVIVGEYQTYERTVPGSIISFLKGKTKQDFLSIFSSVEKSDLESFFLSHSPLEITSLAVQIVDLQSSYIIQLYPFKELCQISPIILCHSVLCHIFQHILACSQTFSQCVIPDALEILSWSSGLIFCSLKLFPYVELQRFLDRNVELLLPFLPPSLSDFLAERLAALLERDTEYFTLFLDSFLNIIDRHFDSSRQHFSFCFDDQIFDDRDLDVQSMDFDDLHFFSKSGCHFFQYHVLLLASACSHVNQILPIMTLSQLLFQLLREQRLVDVTDILRLILIESNSDRLELIILLVYHSLLLWWSSLEFHEPSYILPLFSSIISQLVVILSQHSSLITSLLMKSFRISEILMKWTLSLDLLDHSSPNLRLFSEFAQNIAANLMLYLASNNSFWSKEKVLACSPLHYLILFQFHEFAQLELRRDFSSRNLIIGFIDTLTQIAISNLKSCFWEQFYGGTIPNVLWILKKLLTEAPDSMSYDWSFLYLYSFSLFLVLLYLLINWKVYQSLIPQTFLD